MSKTTKARLRRGETSEVGSSTVLNSEHVVHFEAPIDADVRQWFVSEVTDAIDPVSVTMGGSQKESALVQALQRSLDWIVQHEQPKAKTYVDDLRRKYPDLSSDALAKKILTKASLHAGTAGFLTGLGGLVTLVVTVPANLLVSWRIQSVLAMRIAYLYGAVSSRDELIRDIVVIMCGDQAKSALAKAGIATANSLAKKAVDRFVTAAVMEQIWKVIPRTVLTKAGEKSLLSFTRMVPGAGGAIGFAVDWSYAQAVGRAAIKYYRDMG